MEGENGVPQVEIEKSESLRWEDLVFLAGKSWGLRHESNLEIAKKNFAGGLESGDAISISAPNNLISESVFPDSIKQTVGYLLGIQQLQMVPENQRGDVVNAFEIAIKDFIKDSVGMDISRQPVDKNVRELISELTSNGLAFLVANFKGAEAPYDNKNYYGLGKCGKQTVAKEDMVFMFDGTSVAGEIQSSSGLTEEEMSSPVNSKTFTEVRDALAEKMWIRLVSGIKAQQGKQG